MSRNFWNDTSTITARNRIRSARRRAYARKIYRIFEVYAGEELLGSYRTETYEQARNLAASEHRIAADGLRAVMISQENKYE